MLDLPFCTVKLATMALTPEQLADIRTRIPARPETDIPMPYEDLVRKILTEGTLKSDRTGTGTVSLFGQQMRFDLSEYFPLLTTKTVFFKGLAYELLWFLKGSTNVRWLQERNVHIWDEWADENGDLGPVYGAQWRSWPAPTPDDPNRTIDQISNVLDLVENHPDSRRMVVSAWNPAEVENMALPPCHALFQFYVPRRTVQYRILFAVDVDDRSAGGTAAGGVRVDGWRLPRVRQSHRPGVGAVEPRSIPVSADPY